MTSAASLAMSTAVSTEMPTSAARSAGESLMPSPMNPTTCPLLCKALMMRCLWAGDRRTNNVVLFGGLGQLGVGHRLDLLPRSTWSSGRPTSWQILRRTSSLSPGEHLDRDAVLLKGGDGRPGCVLGRIEEGDVALQDQVALVVLASRRAWARGRDRRSPARESRRR